MLEYQPQDLEGRHFREITVEEDRPTDMALFTELMAGERENYSIDKRYLTSQGDVRWGRLTVSVARHGPPLGDLVVAVVQDITQSKLQQATIFQQANFDALTGLPNRNLTLDRLREQMRLTDRSGLPCFVLFLDLDGFKPVNDLLGHKVGDEVLKEIAVRFSGLVRSTDSVGRFGGDEFVVLLGQVEDILVLERVLHDMLQAARNPMPQVKKGLELSASIGIARYPGDGDTPTELIQHADTAMYMAKKGGRNGFRYFAPRMNEEAERRAQLRREVALALDEGQFELHFQPVWDPIQQRPTSAEALVRWRHPLRGLVPPADFIPFAEETGQILDIGTWVLDTAAEHARAWKDRWGPDFRVAFNVSAEQFATHALLQQVVALGEDMHSLIMEITESMLLETNPLVRDTLNAVRQAGGQVALDDFGTGYSSLSYLQTLPVDEIKIDKRFVDRIAADANGKTLVKAIVSIAQAIDAHLVAEGVELATQARFLQGFDNLRLQGWYVARPMPREQFEAWMDNPPNPHAAAEKGSTP
jgi:diguanylate cyclase (GGDEF)-like protein/PAS domain S-box-containing protein